MDRLASVCNKLQAFLEREEGHLVCAREGSMYKGIEGFRERVGCQPRDDRVSRVCRSPE